MSGVFPYHTKRNDQLVILALSRRELPERPDGMQDEYWRLIQVLCAIDPSTRPSANKVVRHLELLHLTSQVPNRVSRSCSATLVLTEPVRNPLHH